MSGTRAARLAELFARAVELDTAARQALLERECAADPALRAELERLLAADAGEWAAVLDASADGPALRLPAPGEWVAGRYRIVARVGEGGMGVVFAAEQVEPQRRVALKCIRPDRAAPELVARFRREARLLGRLQHPGIAQVYEAGVAEGSPPLPFLAMEFVAGRGLAEHCAGLPLGERVELFVQVAEAVGHAHQRGVVHRDLKPANVLVETGSAGPRARVLDFGVARLVDDAATLHTRTQQLVGTLGYLSPEQVERGSASADARSDVWSLGVTLFELLAGRPPFELRGLALAEAARVLRDDEPARLDRLVPALRGDVATIVHKALAKDPARRYADADELAADLRRHLADQPIAARPPGTVYRLTRLARRHRGLFAGLATAFAVLLVGLVVAALLAVQAAEARDRAEARTRELRGLLRAVVVEVDGELETVAGTTPARRRLLATGLRFCAGLAEDAGDDPEVLLEVATTYLALAAVQGVPGGANLGDVEGALQTLARAGHLVAQAARSLDARGVGRQAAERVLLEVLEARESLQRALGRSAERAATLAQIEATATALTAQLPATEARGIAARAALVRARERADAGDRAAALAGYQRCAEDAAAAWTAGAASTADRRRLAVIEAQCAALLQQAGEVTAARAALERAVAAHEQVLAAEPGVPSLRGLAAALRELAGHLAVYERDPAGALTLLERGRDLLAEPAQQEPQNVPLVRLFLLLEFGVGDALARLRRNDEALAVLERYVPAIEAFAARPGQLASRRDGLAGRQQLALVLGRMGRREDAERTLAVALDTARAEVQRQPDLALAHEDLALTLGVLGALLEGYARHPEEVPEVRRACAARAVAAYREQEQVLGEMDARGLLVPSKRGVLEALPARIRALGELGAGR